MTNRLKLTGMILSAALLLSGCSENNSPAAQESSATTTTTTAATAIAETSAANTSAASAPTAAKSETTTPAETTDTTTAETAATETAAETTAEYTTAVTTVAKTTTTTTAAGTPPEPTAPDPDDILMYLDNDVLTYGEGEYRLELTIEYNGADGNASYYTGANYDIERLGNGGTWDEFPFADEMTWIAIAYEVSVESRAVIHLNLSSEMFDMPFEPGTYRVRKNIGGTDFYAEFEITDEEFPRDDEPASQDLIINEIRDDMFVCYNLIPLPYIYNVICDTSRYEDFCVGDQIEVIYYNYDLDPDDEFVMNIYPAHIGYSYTQLDPNVCYKPVIYLYPQEKTDVSVTLDFNGTLTLTDPEYRNGWTVTAYPDGTLISDGEKYPYLFWEGDNNFTVDTSEGFCVSGADTGTFLREKLAYLGLNDIETAEFLEFWLPHMERNPYNIITFAGADYTDNAALTVSPAPDTVIRVFMVFSPSEKYVDIPAQQLNGASGRNGFTVVEWGGMVK